MKDMFSTYEQRILIKVYYDYRNIIKSINFIQNKS